MSAVTSSDDLFRAYVNAAEADSERLLNQLCAAVLYPLVGRIVEAKLFRYRNDVEDVVQDVVGRLATTALPHIRATRQSTITSYVAWTVRATVNECAAFLRKKHPLRTQLAYAVRYRIESSVVFQIWSGSGNVRLCGWRRCRPAPPLTLAKLREVLAVPSVSDRVAGVNADRASTVWKALAGIFAVANGSVVYKQLVIELIDRALCETNIFCEADEAAEFVGHTSADEPAIVRELLQLLWRCVLQLPRERRLAFLLNLRGKEGLDAFWVSGAVPKENVAEAVELGVDRLEELPWRDIQIANHIDRRSAIAICDGLDEVPKQSRDSEQRQQRVTNLRRDAKRQFQECVARAGAECLPS